MHNKCLGIFLVFITIPLVIVSIIQLGSWKLIKPSYYKDLLKKSNSYTALVKAIPKPENQETGNIFAVIQANMTPAWLEQNVEKNLTQLDRFINNKNKTLDLSLDITPFREQLVTNAPGEAKEMVPNELSLQSYSKLLSDTSNLMKNTSASDPSISQSDMDQIQAQVVSTEKLNAQLDQNSKQIKQGFSRVKIVGYIVFGITLLMLFFIGLAARHWLPAIFRWIGVTLFIPGILTMGISFIVKNLAIRFNPIGSLKASAEIKQVLSPLYQNLISDMTSRIGIIALVVAIIGIISLILSYILPKFIPEPQRPSPQSAPIPARNQ